MNSQVSNKGPALLIVMDGWGLGTGGEEDAIAMAHTPVFDRLWENYAHTELMTHGLHVGLPSDKDMGGSEVGHLTMGAGQILDQGPTRINKAMDDGSFFKTEVLQQVIEQGKNHTLHLLGLLSDGNIHSHLDHFIAVIHHAFEQGVTSLRVHALLDGRDVGIQTAEEYVAKLEAVFAPINEKLSEKGGSYAFASAGGREVMTMDRDQDWDKVKIGWDAMVHGESPSKFTTMSAAIEFLRQQQSDIIDQDLPGFVIVDEQQQPIGAVQDGDAVIMMNFRGDRAIEITEAFCVADFDGFDRGGIQGKVPTTTFAGMMVYDEDRNLPELQLMGPTKVENPFGKRILERGIKQFRLTETQKYPHVTFFFNGGYRQPLDASMEDYILIPSDKGVSFADFPEMKAPEIAAKAVQLIESGEYGFGLINLANADMVGHCGKTDAAIKAVEAVDAAVGKIVDALEAAGGCALVTADHGNAEEMMIAKDDGYEPCTKHSINPVPCILFDPTYDKSYQLGAGGLANIAATLFDMMGQPIPDELEPSLIQDC